MDHVCNIWIKLYNCMQGPMNILYIAVHARKPYLSQHWQWVVSVGNHPTFLVIVPGGRDYFT